MGTFQVDVKSTCENMYMWKANTFKGCEMFMYYLTLIMYVSS